MLRILKNFPYIEWGINDIQMYMFVSLQYNSFIPNWSRNMQFLAVISGQNCCCSSYFDSNCNSTSNAHGSRSFFSPADNE